MDVKPSNVLIASDGLPMLLDFHLARKPIKAGERIADRLGGTPGWMAPEQEEAMKAVSLGQAVPKSVDHRADIYALGLLLRDALRIPSPSVDGTPGTWRSSRDPRVSTGLTDIVAKCLATQPSARYPDAAALADDLRRHLNDLPLRGVANRSLVERWRKWRRRQPGALRWGSAWCLTLSAMLVAASLGLAFHRQRLHEIETDLEDGRKLRLEHQFPDAVRVLSRGRLRMAAVPAGRPLCRPVGPGAPAGAAGAEGRRAALARRLDPFSVRPRSPVGGGSLNPDPRCSFHLAGEGPLAQPGGWQSRHRPPRRVSEPTCSNWPSSGPICGSASPPRTRSEEARREAIEVLDQAEAVCGPSPALSRERRALHGKVGRHDPSLGPEPAPRSAWEHYDLGRSYLRSGSLREADAEFQRTLDQRPQDFWPNFYQGLCAYHLKQFEASVAAFRTCIALAPETAECYYNRGLANAALGRNEHAFSDYSRALELDPALDVGRDQSRDPLLRGRPPPRCAERLPASTPECQLGPGDRSAASTTISPSPTWRSVMWPAPLPAQKPRSTPDTGTPENCSIASDKDHDGSSSGQALGHL